MSKFVEKKEVNLTTVDETVKSLKMGDMDIFRLRELIKCPTATDSDMYTFVALCTKYDLNPILNEIYMIKYKSRDGKDKPASIILSKTAWLKRARANPRYDGHETGDSVDKSGEMYGWAKVKLKGISLPITYKAYMSEYKSSINPIWNSKPRLMITKCALVGALREAFPDTFANLYDINEFDKEREQVVELENPQMTAIFPEKNKQPAIEGPKKVYMSKNDAVAEISALTFDELCHIGTPEKPNKCKAILEKVAPAEYDEIKKFGMMRKAATKIETTHADMVQEQVTG
tara:strand:- start:5225 stop:6088 length:864 start_codon:yes stop_codon:yes gene_type:complete